MIYDLEIFHLSLEKLGTGQSPQVYDLGLQLCGLYLVGGVA